jgi:antitoxin ParD1/3/4
MPTLTITIPDHLAVALGDAAGDGSPAELACAILDAWHQEQGFVEPDIETLRRLYEEGIASGPPVAFDLDEIKAKARQRLAEQSKVA